MSSSHDSLPPGPALLDHRRPLHSLLRWVSTSNPLYVVSAALFLFGLWISFGAQTREVDAWALSGGLTGYTLLLAGAAFILVRVAGVWNDVRTVLLLVVLMFLATSVTFDELLVLDPTRGRWYFLGGLVFAIVLSETILRGIRLRLPVGFRVPYHLTLTLFFSYPVVLEPFSRDPHDEALLWGLWGFAPAAGLVFLTLIPAARRGPEDLRDNGSPWPWPFYPWSVFAFLAIAVCGRAFLLCWSFHLLPVSDRELVFGPYFLVPFGLAIVIVLLETGVAANNRWVLLVVVAMPVSLVVMSAVGHSDDAIYQEFVRHFARRVGATPLYATVVAVGLFYTYAWIRRVTFAPEGLTVVFAFLAFIRPDALTGSELVEPQWNYLVAAAAVQMWVAVRRRDVWRLSLGAAAGVGRVGTIACRGYLKLREEVVGLDYLAVGLVLLPLAVLWSLSKAGVLTRSNSYLIRDRTTSAD